MMGWGIAIVLLVERGIPWWAAAGIAVLGPLLEFCGSAFYDGIKQVRKDRRAEATR